MKKNLLALATVGFMAQSCGWETVDTGRRGLLVNYGRVDHANVLKEGVHFYNPWSYDLIELDIRSSKWSGKLASYSKDSQTIEIEYAFTLATDEAFISKLYEKYGRDYATKIIPQKVTGRIKDVMGLHEAMEIIAKRALLTKNVEKELTLELAKEGFIFSGLELVNIDFDDAFEQAVRNKVVSVQEGIRAQNETVKIREESNQQIIRANAEAESMKIRSQALSQNKGLVEYEAVQKWNGVLPQYMMGNTTPFINLGK